MSSLTTSWYLTLVLDDKRTLAHGGKESTLKKDSAKFSILKKSLNWVYVPETEKWSIPIRITVEKVMERAMHELKGEHLLTQIQRS